MLVVEMSIQRVLLFRDLILMCEDCCCVALQGLLLCKDYTSSVSFRNLPNSETDFVRNRNKMVES